MFLPNSALLGAPTPTDRARTFVGKIVVLFFSSSLLLLGQNNTGELRLTVTDPSGLAVKSLIQIISEANQYRRILSTDDQGTLTLQRLRGRHRSVTQCGRTTDNELLGRRKPDSKDEASFLARRQKLWRGERMG